MISPEGPKETPPEPVHPDELPDEPELPPKQPPREVPERKEPPEREPVRHDPPTEPPDPRDPRPHKIDEPPEPGAPPEIIAYRLLRREHELEHVAAIADQVERRCREQPADRDVVGEYVRVQPP